MKPLIRLLGLVCLTVLIGNESSAQTTSVSTAQPDSIVQITADEMGLTPVASTDLPRLGTFWVIVPGNDGNVAALPYPGMPAAGLPVYGITNNIFLVDGTGGQVLANTGGRQADSAMIASALMTQANAVSNLISWIRSAAANPQRRMASSFSPMTFSTNSLWIEISLLDQTNQLATVTAHNTLGTEAYQLFSKTNLMQLDWTPGEVIGGNPGANQSDFDPVSITNIPIMFFRGQQTNIFIQILSVQNALRPNSILPGHDGIVEIQAGTFFDNTLIDLAANFRIGGTASNGVDYSTISSPVTVPANPGYVEIHIHSPQEYRPTNSVQTVILTLFQSDAYLIDPYAYSITNYISDNTNVFWPVAGLTEPIGIDYDVLLNSLIVSYNYSGGTPNNFGRVYTTVVENVTNTVIDPWSGISGLGDEVYFATIKANAGGFTKGDLYYGSNTGIGWLSADGTVSNLNWCILTNSAVTNALLLRGGLCIDQTGIFSNDIIAVTSSGADPTTSKGVWRVDSQAHPTLLTNLATLHLEGVITLPNDTNRFGPWAGKIITGDEDEGVLYSIDTNSAVISYDTTNMVPGGIGSEDFDIIPTNQSLYACDPDIGKMVKLSAPFFTNYVGDLLITQAGDGQYANGGAALFIVKWNSATTNFEIHNVNYYRQDGTYGHLEHVTFAPIDLPLQ